MEMAIPAGRTLYQVSSLYFSWGEVYADLEARAGFSGVLAWNAARFWWAQGRPLGGSLNGEPYPELAALARREPAGRLTLTELPAGAVAVAHAAAAQHRAGVPAALPWDEAQEQVRSPGFTGAVLLPGRSLLWQGGRQLCGGELPQAGEAVTLLSTGAELSAERLVRFWNRVLSLHTELQSEAEWRAAALELADDHPCLDPFAREVILRRGELHLDADVPPEELQPALLAALGQMMARAGLSVRDPLLAALTRHPLWESSGAGGLP